MLTILQRHLDSWTCRLLYSSGSHHCIKLFIENKLRNKRNRFIYSFHFFFFFEIDKLKLEIKWEDEKKSINERQGEDKKYEEYW